MPAQFELLQTPSTWRSWLLDAVLLHATEQKMSEGRKGVNFPAGTRLHSSDVIQAGYQTEAWKLLPHDFSYICFTHWIDRHDWRMAPFALLNASFRPGCCPSAAITACFSAAGGPIPTHFGP